MAKKASAAMMDYCCEPQFSSQEIDHILRALSVRDADAIPVLAATTGENGKSKMVFASRTMLTLFRIDDLAALSAKFFEGDEPGAKRAATLATTLAQDGAPRLERLTFLLGARPETITFLCRKISGAEGSTFLVAAALGVRAWLLNAADGSVETPSSEQPSEAAAAPILSVEEVRNALAARIGARTTIRFLWRTDAEDKITEITPPLAEVVGAAAADLLGHDFGDVAKYLESEPDGQLSRTFAKRETFSGIEVLWPVASATAAVPVGLGGLPAFDRERRFDGYRGFGVIHVARLAAAEPRPLFGETSEGTMPEPPRASNVVRLPLPHPPAPRLVESILSSDSRDNSLLSFDEHTAFREIAQVLAEEAASTAAARDAADPDVEGAQAPKAANEGHNLAAILDRVGLGVLVSRDDVAIYANRPLLDLLGFADEDAVHAAGGMGRLFEQRNNGESIGLRTASGEVITRRARIQSIEWDGLPATLLTLRRDDEPDDSGRLEDELRVQKAEARELNAVLDTATDGLAVLDSQGRIVTLSRSAEALFGIDQSEVAGKPLTVLIAVESQDKVRDYFESLRGHGVASLLNDGREIVGHAHQGGLIPIFMTLGRIGPAQSDPAEQKFCALFRDMTHWKKVEQELKEARLEAERASALKSDFLAKVSHEIRTPLNAILGFAEVIMEERFGPIGNERYRDYLKDIHTSGTHVMSLVNDLLDLSKIEAGKMDLSFVSVDVNRAISEAVAIMQPQANQERIIMRLALAPHLPRIVADERSLRQILLNLLSNAVKFNEPGGQVIVATALTDGGNAVIRIRDTGIGMSEEDIETALEPFRQLATTRQTSGTGLGLPLTKALVEANRAFFTIKSKKKEGTMVEIAFPSARVLAE